MEYTLVELPESHIIGPTIHTGNEDPQVTEKIGTLWQEFMESAGQSVPNPIVEPYSCYGLYYNYDFTDMKYDMMVGCESSADVAPAGMEIVTIPAGKYAKFSIKGNVVQAVVDAWNKIWAMDDLAAMRTYTVDFEAYLPGEDMDNSEIDLYIAVK